MTHSLQIVLQYFDQNINILNIIIFISVVLLKFNHSGGSELRSRNTLAPVRRRTCRSSDYKTTEKYFLISKNTIQVHIQISISILTS